MTNWFLKQAAERERRLVEKPVGKVARLCSFFLIPLHTLDLNCAEQVGCFWLRQTKNWFYVYIYMCRSCTLWLVYSQIKPIWQPAFPLNGSVSNSIIYSVPLISCESPKTRLVCKHSHIHLPSKMHVHWTLFIINFLFLHFIAYYMSSNIVY